MDFQGRRWAADRVWQGYLLAGALAITGYYLLLARHAPPAIAATVYLLASVSSAVMVFVGCARNQPRAQLRRPWLLLGVGQVVYAIADIIFYLGHDVFGQHTFPGPADPFYLAHYPLIVAGLMLLIRLRSPRRDLPGRFDAAGLTVVAAMLSWLYIIGPTARIEAPMVVRLVSVAYPVLDLALLIVSSRLILAPSSRPASFVLLSVSLLAILVADSAYLIQLLLGRYAVGNYLDGIWLAGNLTLGAAALHPTMGRLDEPRPEPDVRISPARLALITGIALIAPATLVLQDAFHALRDIPIIASVGAAACVLTIARLTGLLIDQRRLAITDPLTGLRTRRYFESQLPSVLERARRQGSPLSMLIINVDHFRSVNDRYGHQAGDRALREIARRVRDTASRGDLLARYGGEEFTMVTPVAGVGQLAALAERLRERIANTPIVVLPEVWIALTVSVGAARFPADAATTAELVVSADRALYTAKARGRDRAVIGDSDQVPLASAAAVPGPEGMLGYLRRFAEEVDAAGGGLGRSRQLGRWAGLVAAELGLPESVVRRAEIAGELCGIGKALTLRVARTTSSTECRIEQVQVEHSYQLIRMVPGLLDVATVVRQHRECWDGSGCPDGLAGTEIRMEARILAVCDAWAALTANRSYQQAPSVEQAPEDLLRGRGSRFDPAVVDAFLLLRQREMIGDLPVLRSAERG